MQLGLRAGAAVVAAAVVLLLVLAGSNQAAHPPTSAQAAPAPAPVRPQPAVSAVAPVVSPPPARAASANDLFAPRDEDRFAIEPLAVVWDDSCADAEVGGAFDDLDQVLRDTGLDLERRIPDASQVVDLAQFYTDGDGYLQLTARWNYDQPARYRIELTRFDDARFSNPRAESLASVADWVDASELAGELERIDRALRQRSARRGARSVVLANHLPAMSENPELAVQTGYVVEMRNGRPMRFHGAGVACHTRGDRAVCSCPDTAHEHEHGNESGPEPSADR